MAQPRTKTKRDYTVEEIIKTEEIYHTKLLTLKTVLEEYLVGNPQVRSGGGLGPAGPLAPAPP